jgi:hypothetical protein
VSTTEEPSTTLPTPSAAFFLNYSGSCVDDLIGKVFRRPSNEFIYCFHAEYDFASDSTRAFLRYATPEEVAR